MSDSNLNNIFCTVCHILICYFRNKKGHKDLPIAQKGDVPQTPSLDKTKILGQTRDIKGKA